MARILIAYYSRTGVTRTLATALAERLHADIVEIRCPRYRPGVFRYLRAGYDSVRGNLPAIDMAEMDALERPLAGYDLVLLGAPVWTSHPALPLRTLLATGPELPDRVALFLTYGGHSAPDIAVAETEAQLGRPVAASLALQAKVVRSPGLAAAVDAFARKLELNSHV